MTLCCFSCGKRDKAPSLASCSTNSTELFAPSGSLFTGTIWPDGYQKNAASCAIAAWTKMNYLASIPVTAGRVELVSAQIQGNLKTDILERKNRNDRNVYSKYV